MSIQTAHRREDDILYYCPKGDSEKFSHAQNRCNYGSFLLEDVTFEMVAVSRKSVA